MCRKSTSAGTTRKVPGLECHIHGTTPFADPRTMGSRTSSVPDLQQERDRNGNRQTANAWLSDFLGHGSWPHLASPQARGVVWRRAPSVGCGIRATTNGECRGRKMDNRQRCNAHCSAIVHTIIKEMTDFGFEPTRRGTDGGDPDVTPHA